jgi:hypothetical protein
MNLSTQGIRRLATALGVAALLVVAGCDDESDVPPIGDPPDIPTLERTAPGAP